MAVPIPKTGTAIVADDEFASRKCAATINVTAHTMATGVIGRSPHLRDMLQNSKHPTAAIAATSTPNQGEPIHTKKTSRGMPMARLATREPMERKSRVERGD